MAKNILLTEADYKDKYPPLGLMKIATFHKLNGDSVEYSRQRLFRERTFFDKIYISTRFSFHWNRTKDLIKFYQKNYDSEILIGGIHASINPNIYNEEFGITPNIGSYRGEIERILEKVKKDIVISQLLEEIEKYGIDALPPDYSIFNNQLVPFRKALDENYLLRTTKGCNRNCIFCDVKKICEQYIDRFKILPVIEYIRNQNGQKRNILFYDDNTLISNRLEEIIDDIKKAGFFKGARLNRKLRTCDFNQGMDLRLLNDKKILLLTSINISPFRFAFDDIKMKETYLKNICKVINSGIRDIAVYVLYNFDDTPEDFYERIRLSASLNEKYNTRIMSFPMKYIPNNQTNRKYIGKHWSKRMIRGVQCILNGCHGIVPIKYEYFTNAFGENKDAFLKIIQMPEKYIINRKQRFDDIEEWGKDFDNMSNFGKIEALGLISNHIVSTLPEIKTNDQKIEKFINHYLNEKH